ncbi:glycosyltransferase [Toxoplasma gondii GT1]|uniref:1,4-alpha-glucan branching enzyme n=2 Tax=Toxoplasma gondii TaxID=5811 RepID=A0A125YK23_TOXGG|nr:glycosyltransferase [Toxoplasma gondii GT1]KAF4645845.1 glycosyltransferase [Toxoplasma gondii]CAJ20682.1 putative glycan synthetase [Toxoplasma gondii RH]
MALPTSELSPPGGVAESSHLNGDPFQERQQYITKCPSCSFLRFSPPDCSPVETAYATDVTVFERDQGILVESFLEFTRAVRGTQLQLLREESPLSSASEHRLSVPSLSPSLTPGSEKEATRCLYRIVEGGFRETFPPIPHSLHYPDSVSLSSPKSGKSRSEAVEVTVSTAVSPSTLSLPLGESHSENFSPHSALSHAEAAAAVAARVDAARSSAAVALPGQLNALASHLEHRLYRHRTAARQTDGSPAPGTSRSDERKTAPRPSVSQEDEEDFFAGEEAKRDGSDNLDDRVRKFRVLVAGALLPGVLDGTAVYVQEARLREAEGTQGELNFAGGEKRQTEEEEKEDEASVALDNADFCTKQGRKKTQNSGITAEALLQDLLHDFAYGGLFSCVGGRPEERDETQAETSGTERTQKTVEASVVALLEAPKEKDLGGQSSEGESRETTPKLFLYFHFKTSDEMKHALESSEWAGFQAALQSLCVSGSLTSRLFHGVAHSRREITGACAPAVLDVSPHSQEPTPFVPPQEQAAGPRRDTFDWSTQLDGSAVVQEDPRLRDVVDQLQHRFGHLRRVIESITRKFGSLETFASGHKVFGFQRVEADRGRPGGWSYREWLPHASQVFLFGDFNEWNRTSHPLQREPRDASPFFFETELGLDSEVATERESAEGDKRTQEGGVWSLFIPDHADGSWALPHRSRVRVRVVSANGEDFDRVPAWATVTWKGEASKLFNAVIWKPPREEEYVCRHPSPTAGTLEAAPRVYEAHIGASDPSGERLGTYSDFVDVVLPRIKRLGYNTVLLNGVIEHADYASFGFYVSSPFAVSSRFGTPEEFRRLVDSAHAIGLRVLLSIYHSHVSRNALEGLGNMDGCESTYFLDGDAGTNAEWQEAKLFDFGKTEVLRYLLSNIKFFVDVYNVDGFRFEGVTSMLYTHHGTARRFDPFDYGAYFEPGSLQASSLLYLSIANSLLASLLPSPRRLSIANEWSAFPTLCRRVDTGGLGFDFRHEGGWAQKLRAQLQQLGGRSWRLNELVWTVASKPNTEKVLAAFEDADTTRRCKRPLSVALFSWESLHTHAVGGVAPHVTELAAGLARQGHEVHIFVRATGMEAVTTVHFDVTYHQCTFNLDRDFVKEMGNMCDSFVQRLLQVEASRGETFDICHAHDWLAARAMVRAKQLGRTAVMTMHSTEFGRCGNNAYGGVSKSIRDIEAEACHMADRVICVSGVLAQEVQTQYGIHPEKIKVIYNGIQCERFDGEVDAGEVKAQYGIPAMDPTFLFVGRMVVQKGPDLLLEAIPFILKFRSDAKFVFVGDGHMMGQLVQRCKQLNVGHAVRFVGQRGGAVLHALFKSCDAVVVPSRNEPFGIVVLEAWSSGKPVVATNSGGPRDFVNPHHTGYLVDPEPGSIAWGCCEILKNFEHSRWMGSRGRVTAAFSFSWDSIATQTAEIYCEQTCRHDLPPNCTNARKGDTTMALALVGPALHAHMAVFDDDPNVANGLALWRTLRLLLFVVADGWLSFMGNEFAHPDEVDLPRPANHFSLAKNFRRWNLADDVHLKFKHCEFFEAFLSHWENVFGSQSARHLFVVTCSEEEQVVVLERGDCLVAINLHPTQSYEGFHTGCMYSGPEMQLLFDTDEERFGGFGRLTARSLHPVLSGKDSRPHSVKLYLPSRTGAVYVSSHLFDQRYAARWDADPVMHFTADDFVAHLATVKAECMQAIS